MIDWRRLTKDPTNVSVSRQIDQFLGSITRIEETSRMEMLLDFCRGKSVLDIGAAEHDTSFYSPESWEHEQIRKVAMRAVAAEINPELCAHYNAKGFDFRCVDATSDADLGERFDVAFAGDVIEHVNNPIALLQFIKRHLKPGGHALLTTPNPFAPRFLMHRRRDRTRYVMANLEHTMWLSLSNLHEICLRAGMEMHVIHWPLYKKRKSGFKRKLAILGKRLQLAVRPIEQVFHEYAVEIRPVSERKD
ncbi:MAG: class I SAM-dependent methyltransferase [Alphaproteobacteria bacterium]|jgi:SAM-dependent methyltransferase